MLLMKSSGPWSLPRNNRVLLYTMWDQCLLNKWLDRDKENNQSENENNSQKVRFTSI